MRRQTPALCPTLQRRRRVDNAYRTVLRVLEERNCYTGKLLFLYIIRDPFTSFVQLRTVSGLVVPTMRHIFFITSELILFPRPAERRLEICQLLPSDPPSLATIVFLGLPTPEEGVHCDTYTFQAYPDPATCHASAAPHTRFTSSPSSALFAFELIIEKTHDVYATSLLCVIHRSALIRVAQSALARQKTPLATEPFPPAGYAFIAEPGRGVMMEAQSLVQPPLLPQPSLAYAPWEMWSDGRAAVFKPSKGNWVLHGERLVLYDDPANYMLRVLDFNSYNVHRARTEHNWDGTAPLTLPNGNTLRIVEGKISLEVAGCLKEAVVSLLPYLETTVRGGGLLRYKQVWVDGERIVGSVIEVCGVARLRRLCPSTYQPVQGTEPHWQSTSARLEILNIG
jgi:hypothetical protein